MDRSNRLKLDQPSSILKSAMNRSIAGVPYTDLSSAWDSMDKARSALHRAEHRLTDIEKRSTADVLWNLPDYLFSMIEQDNQSSLNALQTTSESIVSSDLRPPKHMSRKVNKPGRGLQETVRLNETMFNQSDRSVRISSIDSSAGVTDETFFNHSSRYARSKNGSSTADFDLTSSTVIQETDINFLNDFTPLKKPVSLPAARLHRVNVIVPTAIPASKASTTNAPAADVHPLIATTRSVAPSQPKLKITFEDAKPPGNAEAVRNVSDGSQQSSDIESLDRIREMIRRQRNVEQPSSELSASGVSVARKVAVGPRHAVSSYRATLTDANVGPEIALRSRQLLGFSEVDTKSDILNHKLATTKPPRSAQGEGHQPSSISSRPHRNVARPSDVANKDLITTRSWRAGAKLVQEDLGISINGVSPQSKDLRLQLSSAGKGGDPSSAKPSLSSEADLRLRHLVKISAEDASPIDRRSVEKKKIKSRKKTSDDDSNNQKASVKKLYIENKDAAEVRRYMLKRREEHLLHERHEQEKKAQICAKKKQKLVDLMLKQQEIVSASVAARREKAAKQKLSANQNESDKENTKSLGEIDEASYESEPEINVSASRQHGSLQHENSRPARVENTTFVLEPHSRGRLSVTTDDSDKESLSAEQIVNRFAEGAGLSLNDVITNYSQYAHAIQQSFAGRGSGKRVGVTERDVGAKEKSTLSRLRALQSASLHLQSRLQHETVRIRSDFAGQEVEGSQLASDVSRNALRQCVTVDDQKSEESKQAPFELIVPGYMGPQAESRVLTGKDADTVLVQLRNENSTMPSNNREDLRSNQVERGRTQASRTTMLTSRWPKPANYNQHLLKPAKPVEAWKGSEVDPYNIFNILSRDRSMVVVHSKERKLDSGTTPAGDSRQNGDMVSPPPFVEADQSTKLTGDHELNSVSMWSASLSGQEMDTRSGRSALSAGLALGANTAWHRDVILQSAVALQAAAVESQVNSDKEDFSIGSGSLYELSAEHQQKSLSVRPSRPSSKLNNDSIGTELQLSRANINHHTGSDVSEFSEISSLASDQRALTLSEQNHAAGFEQSQDYGRMPGISPAVLDIRMALELSRLDMVDDSLLQVTNIERTRAVSLAQQETVALAQILKGRQQKADHDIASARRKAEDESRELSHRLAVTRQVDATQTLFQAASDATSTLHESARTLLNTQTDMARVTAEAVRQIAETSALVLKRRDEDVETSRRLLSESAATAAASAVACIVDQYQAQRLLADARQADLRRNSEREASVAPRDQPSNDKSQANLRTEMSSVPQSNLSQSAALSNRSSSIASDLSKSVEFASHSTKSSSDKQKEQSKNKDNRSSSHVTEDLAVGTDSETIQATRKRKSALSDNEVSDNSEVHSASDLSMKSESSASNGPAKRALLAPTVDNKTNTENSSVHTAQDSSAEAVSVDEGSVNTESVLKSGPTPASIRSGPPHTEEEKVVDYSFDYDSTLTEDDLERSLREIVPSEGQRKKIRRRKLLDTSAAEGALADDDDELAIAPDDSFTRFNMSMVQQYFREEAIHQQHKHTMLLLRERALKEKTALELACLEQMKQRLRDKGADDKHPDIIRKERNIRKNHQQRQEELRNLQRASKLALEAQQLMLKETQDIAEIHRSSQQVKDKLRRAGLDAIVLSSPENATDEEHSPRRPANESSFISKGSDDEAANDKKMKLNLKLDNKYLTSREKQLQDRRNKAVEKLDVNDRLKLKEKEIEQLENTTKRLQQLKESKSQIDKGSQNVAANGAVDSHPKLSSSSVEDLPSESLTRKWSLASVGEELVSASAVTSSKSVSDKITESMKYSSQYEDSATEESSVIEEVSNAGASSSVSSETTNSKSHTPSKVDSVMEQKATRLASDEASFSKRSSTVKTDLSSKPSGGQLQRQSSVGGELELSLNRSDLTSSDQSDIENRILALSERLQICKTEAEGLRREQRKQRKIKLKAQEQSLKQQIESYDSYIRIVKSELHSSPVELPPSDLQKPLSPLPSFVSSALRVNEAVTKQQTGANAVTKHQTTTNAVTKPLSSDSSGSEMTVLHDNSRVHRTSEHGEPKKRLSSSEHVDKEPVMSRDHSISEVVAEDVQSAVNETSSLKLDLNASSDRPHSIVTPRALDSARTNADIAEDFQNMTPRDLSTARQAMSEVSERVVSSHLVSVASVASYSEDFSSGRRSDGIDLAFEQKQASHKVASEYISENSVPTEEDVSEVSLSGDSESSKPVGLILETFQLEKQQTLVTAEAAAQLAPVTVEAVVQQTPVTAEAAAQQTPVTAEAAAQQTPETAEAVVQQTPVTAEAAAQQTPVTAEAAAQQTPVTAEAAAQQTPLTAEAVAQQTPLTAEAAVPLQPDNELQSLSEAAEEQTSEKQIEAKTAAKDYQKAVDLTTEVLISEAIHQMIGIKRKKQGVTSSEGNSLEKRSATASQTVAQSIAISTTPLETSSPVSGPTSPMEDLDDIYNELTSVKVDDEWRIEREKSSKTQVTRQPAAPPERVMHVPHTHAEISQLVESAVDVLWPSQRDAKLREAARLSFVGDREGGTETVESRNRAVYRRLIFDLSAQALGELFDESAAHVDASTQPWLMPRLRVRLEAPASVADAKPIVCSSVLRRVGLQASNVNTSSRRHTGGRTVRRVRADKVDELLLAELREEESEWTDYTNDELYVKMQLADVLFDMLLTETVSTLNSINRHRNS